MPAEANAHLASGSRTHFPLQADDSDQGRFGAVDVGA